MSKSKKKGTKQAAPKSGMVVNKSSIPGASGHSKGSAFMPKNFSSAKKGGSVQTPRKAGGS